MLTGCWRWWRRAARLPGAHPNITRRPAAAAVRTRTNWEQKVHTTCILHFSEQPLLHKCLLLRLGQMLKAIETRHCILSSRGLLAPGWCMWWPCLQCDTSITPPGSQTQPRLQPGQIPVISHLYRVSRNTLYRVSRNTATRGGTEYLHSALYTGCHGTLLPFNYKAWQQMKLL